MKLSEIKANPNNPRLIKDAKFEKLCKSIEDFPKMMSIRPIIVDNNNVILGGNMRFKALKHLGHKDIPDHWVKRADDLTEEQKKEFIIKDNVGFGEHDWDLLANEWDALDLEEWGLELLTEFDGDLDQFFTDDNSEPKEKKPFVPIVEKTYLLKKNESTISLFGWDG